VARSSHNGKADKLMLRLLVRLLVGVADHALG
jgi:hypothetical protein